ncbi:class I SAM-dependent DNA methyltransferase [Catenuloplanes sp. NPDC051500]|uniref:class I SAM-dependent DNA methyltransferase n=1 Tax=Catenuloplanes sp. NPDC051500 TaxID=3363959 RepID=UPI0037ACEFE5
MTVTADPTAYGQTWAGRYDEWFDDRDSPTDLVAFVDRFAPDRSVLELGVGTGRVALPLARAGYRVHGVDASGEMLARLARKPGGDQITRTEADMSDFALPGRFGAVTCLFSSLFLLPDQDAQIRCLATAARHTLPGGVVIIEGFVLNPQRWNNGRSVDTTDAGVSTGVLHRAEQTIETMRLDLDGDAVTVRRNRLRWALPAELDLMARLAGLDLVFRAQSLAGEPYTDDSDNHVSVYVKPATD